MNVPVRFVVRRRWWARFHPLARVGWNTATMGTTRPATQTIVGFGLIGAGLLLGRRGRRKVLYSGYVEPGTGTHIKVSRGNRTIHDAALGDD